jgi:hypothetical protein
MALVMRDSVTIADIPVEGTQVAVYYSTGPYANGTACKQRFPGIDRIGVDVNGTMPGAEVRDWETGDKGGSLEQWVINHNNVTGYSSAVVYCDRATIPEVRQLTGSQVLGTHYWLWVATLDGTVFGPSDYPHVIACQWKGTAQTGGNYDESIVWATPWIYAAPAPKPAATISVNGIPVGRPDDVDVPCVISWYGDAGLDYKYAEIPQAVWQHL